MEILLAILGISLSVLVIYVYSGYLLEGKINDVIADLNMIIPVFLNR